MDYLQAIIYGIVQGITEFLPISSTAHLVLLPWFFGWEDQGLTFNVALHFGTLLALVCFFRAEWLSFGIAAVNVIQRKESGVKERLVKFIAIATIPGATAGLFAEELIEAQLRHPLVIAFTLIGLALALAAAERRGRRYKEIGDLSWVDAIFVGMAQALALVPGVSRSGVTITAALFRGVKREAAARFSLLLSTPIIAGAAVKKAFEFPIGNTTNAQLMPLVVGIIVSSIVGYLAVGFLLTYLSRHTTYVFIYYRLLLGVVVLLAFWFGFR